MSMDSAVAPLLLPALPILTTYSPKLSVVLILREQDKQKTGSLREASS